MQSHSRVRFTAIDGWADLPHGLLHSIISVLGSFRALLAVAATCRSWRSAFSTYPSRAQLCRTLFPPLLIQPIVDGDGAFRVVDPVDWSTVLRWRIDGETLQELRFVGSSYGHVIFFRRRGRRCLVVNPLTGDNVSPPPLPPLGGRHEDEEEEEEEEEDSSCHYYGVLTAPLASPSSHLVVSTDSSLFDWPVGSDSWSELQLTPAAGGGGAGRIDQIVEFDGQFIAMDHRQRIHNLQLQVHPHRLALQEIPAQWPDPSFALRPLAKASWLVVCGGAMIEMAMLPKGFRGTPMRVSVLHRLDMSTAPARWVEVNMLDGWALFAGWDARATLSCCAGPERWGGMSNRVYEACCSPSSSSWIVYPPAEEPEDDLTELMEDQWTKWRDELRPLYLYPSMFY